jgi:hypothetical protein
MVGAFVRWAGVAETDRHSYLREDVQTGDLATICDGPALSVGRDSSNSVRDSRLVAASMRQFIAMERLPLRLRKAGQNQEIW